MPAWEVTGVARRELPTRMLATNIVHRSFRRARPPPCPLSERLVPIAPDHLDWLAISPLSFVPSRHVTYRVLAGTVVLTHVAFVLFVVLGGLLVLRWRRVVWMHVPAVMWAVMLELADLGCP